MIMILGAIVILSVFASTVSAFTTSEKVIVANRIIAIARTPAGGYTADQRIGHINDRLAYILGYEPLAPRDIRAVPVGDSYAIMVGNRLLLTVTPADARANNTTLRSLTRVWLRYAREAIPQARPNMNLPVA
jgi:hypothetical protein